MRACFVVHDPSWCGATRAFADAATLLAARGYETCFAAPSQSDAERALRAAGHDAIGVATGGGWVRQGWHLRRVIAARLTEVVFVHTDREHLVAAAAVRLAGRGAVVRRTAAGDRLSLGRDGRLAMRIAATGFVFAHADDLRSATPPARALAAHIAPPGVAFAPPRPAAPAAVGAIRPPAPHLLIVAGADRRRDLLVAIRTLALLAPRRPELRTVIVTSAADADLVRVEAAALGVADRVTCLPPQTALADALRGAALAWVIASADDAVYAMLDALASGVPVLSERSPLAARYIEDGVSGLLRHRAEDAEWASVIAGLLARPDQGDTMRAGAREAAARAPFDAGAEGWLLVADAARDRTRWTT
ncbi:MAG: glycosyltransferase family 4 protein [Gemmatimonadaceae bacterium]|nr:glycosyltransferase family 4 protein [Gemmatimonadaceae bacterium]